MRNPFTPKGSGVSELMRSIPKDGCLLVFNAHNVGTWRTVAYRFGLSVFVTNPGVAHAWNYQVPKTRDLYITGRD